MAFADVVSSDVVGYTTTSYADRTMVAIGTPFLNVSDSTIKLSDFTATGFDPTADILQTIDPDTADTVDSYVYVDPDEYGEALGGWWLDDMSEKADDVAVSQGTGFMAAFGSDEVSLTGAGKVSSSAVTVSYADMTMAIVPNILPRTLTLSELTASGFDPTADILQTIDPDTADTVDSYVYVDPEEYGEALGGWWIDDMSEKADDVEIDAGEGMMGAFGSDEVEITFPAAI